MRAQRPTFPLNVLCGDQQHLYDLSDSPGPAASCSRRFGQRTSRSFHSSRHHQKLRNKHLSLIFSPLRYTLTHCFQATLLSGNIDLQRARLLSVQACDLLIRHLLLIAQQSRIPLRSFSRKLLYNTLLANRLHIISDLLFFGHEGMEIYEL